MKDTKFLELLNLYLDHEISADDAALLEAEIQANPQRRRIYKQYCQIQKACTVLAHDFRTQAPAAPAANIVQFPRRRSPARVIAYAGGLLAAAACVAVIFVSRSRLEQSVSIPVATAPVQQTARISPSFATATLTKVSSQVRPALQPVFYGLTSDTATEDKALLAVERAQLDWMNRVQFQRVPLEELRFESRPNAQSNEHFYSNRRSLQGQVEMTAFRFQR